MADPAAPESVEVLIVEDNPADVQLVREAIKDAGMEVELGVVADGVEALERLRGGTRLPALILTDLKMPRMNGLELVETVRRDHPSVPVVVMTAYGNEEIAFQSLLRGAASYVPKKSLADGLAETLRQVLAVSRAEREDGRLLERLAGVEHRYVLDNDVSLIPPLTRQLATGYARMLRADETGQIRLSIALHEALVNAVFHGNLEMGSHLRESESLTEGFYALADRRRGRPPWRDRRVHVTAKVTPDDAIYVVRDEGAGFNPASLPDPRDRSNVGRVAGRGLFLIRLFMDEVRHNATGNEITLVKRRGR